LFAAYENRRRNMDGDDGAFLHAAILACFHRMLGDAIVIDRTTIHRTSNG